MTTGINTKIDSIRELDFEVHEIFEKNGGSILKLIKSDKIPKTANTFLIFIVKTNFIKESIFELSESKNIYAINILFRSLIEHFLRFQYIFFRFLADKDDSIGEEYTKFCSLSENIEMGKALNEIAKILQQKPTTDPYELLKELKLDFEKYSKKDISNVSEKFRYKNIIRFINSRLNKDNKFEGNEFLLKLIPVYSDLSSFVHGGPNADKTLFQTNDEKVRHEEVVHKIQLSFMIAAAVKMFSYLVFYQYDKRFNDAYSQTQALIDKFNTGVL